MQDNTQSNQNLNEQLVQAQLDKLKLEIQSIKRKNKWEEKLARYIPLLTVLITVAGFCFGIYQFRALADIEARRNVAEGKEALDRVFWEETILISLEVSDTAGIIASSPRDSDARKKAEERFKQLKNGTINTVAIPSIVQAVNEFDKCLEDKECAETQLPTRAVDLSSNIGEKLGKIRDALVKGTEKRVSR